MFHSVLLIVNYVGYMIWAWEKNGIFRMFSSFKSSFFVTSNLPQLTSKKIVAIQNIARDIHDLWILLLRRQIKDIDLLKNVSFWHTREYCRNDCNTDFLRFSFLYFFLCVNQLPMSILTAWIYSQMCVSVWTASINHDNLSDKHNPI